MGPRPDLHPYPNGWYVFGMSAELARGKLLARKFMGQEMKSTLEVTAFETNARWAARVIKGPVPYEVTATFEPSGAGTKMTTRVDGEPKGFFKVAEGMLKGQLEKSLEEDANRLKRLLENA